MNNFQLIKYYSETLLFPNFSSFQNQLMLIFRVSDVLSMFHCILFFLCKYKGWRIPNGLIQGTFC